MEHILKVFVSQPMNGRLETEIEAVRNNACSNLRELLKREIPDIDFTFMVVNHIHRSPHIPEDVSNVRLVYLGEAIQDLSRADCVIFAEGSMDAHGCSVERAACEEYNVNFIFECDIIKYLTARETSENSFNPYLDGWTTRKINKFINRLKEDIV